MPAWGKEQYQPAAADWEPVPFEAQVAAVGELIKEGKVRSGVKRSGEGL